MNQKAADVLSLANAVSASGLLLTINGARRIDEPAGLVDVAVGRALDLLDGPIARATHASRFGAAMDATCDKAGVAAIGYNLWTKEVAPKPLLSAIGVQNLANAAISLGAEKQGKQLEVSRAGKVAMFLQNISMLGYALSASIRPERWREPIRKVSLIIGVGGLALGLRATEGYFRASQEANSTTPVPGSEAI